MNSSEQIQSAKSAAETGRMREMLRRQQIGFRIARYYRWRDLRSMDHESQVEKIEGLLSIGVNFRSDRKVPHGMSQWYRLLREKTQSRR